MHLFEVRDKVKSSLGVGLLSQFGAVSYLGCKFKQHFLKLQVLVDVHIRYVIVHLKELHEVVELAMDVSTDCDGRLQFYHSLLAAQQGRPLIDDLEGCVLVHPPLEDEVLFQHLRLWLVCPRVKDFTHTQLI